VASSEYVLRPASGASAALDAPRLAGRSTNHTLRNEPMRTLVIGALALLLAFLSALPASPAAADPGGPDPAPDPAVAELERNFLTGMIPHHRGAVQMAELAVQKATRPELRRLAQRMIDEQRSEIDTMTHWLRDWYGMEAPAGTSMPMGMMSEAGMEMMHQMMDGMMPDEMARMRALETKSGADFDVEFMSAMVDHHAMAVMMAAPVLIGGHHADLYTLAENVVISQGEEIKQLDEWLEAWYGVKRPV
jgi:uncharacterized protein (DUF305 family)